MFIDKSKNTISRIWATWTNNTGNAAYADTSAKITIYPANSNTPIVAQTDLTQFATGVYYYPFDVSNVATGQYAVRFTFVDGAVTQEYMQNLEVIDSTDIWDVQQAEHTTAGTFGYYLDGRISTAGQGNGSIPNTITINDVDNTAEGGVAVIVYADAGMSIPVTGTLYTDNEGKVTVFLNPGTYYIRAEKEGKSFSNPTTLTVT